MIEIRRLKRLIMVRQASSMGLIELASTFNEDAYLDESEGHYIMTEGGQWLNLSKVTTKEMQLIQRLRLIW